jgi:hypothetical protein
MVGSVRISQTLRHTTIPTGISFFKRSHRSCSHQAGTGAANQRPRPGRSSREMVITRLGQLLPDTGASRIRDNWFPGAPPGAWSMKPLPSRLMATGPVNPQTSRHRYRRTQAGRQPGRQTHRVVVTVAFTVAILLNQFWYDSLLTRRRR